jgi:hypothetical protein
MKLVLACRSIYLGSNGLKGGIPAEIALETAF